MNQLIKRLNEENNFHLALKVIQVTDCQVSQNLKDILCSLGKSCEIIDNDNPYETLKKAYDEKTNYIIAGSNDNYLLPLVVVINNDNVDVIKPMIPTLYLLKDNKIIQKVKTKCNKLSSPYFQIKDEKEIISYLF